MDVRKIFLAILIFIAGSNHFLDANSGFSGLYNKASGLCRGAVNWFANNQKSSAVIGVTLLAVAATGAWYWYRYYPGRRFPDFKPSGETNDILNKIYQQPGASSEDPAPTNNESKKNPAFYWIGKNKFKRLKKGGIEDEL